MSSGDDWWKTFFSGPVVDFWLNIPSAEQTRHEADFLQTTLAVRPPARLLDVPCGGGRHCHAMAARGYEMTGVELSPGLLEAARASPASPQARIHWESREMRDLPWPEQFDGAYSLGNSFGYMDDAGNFEFLKAIVRTLKPGARFILETGYVLETILPTLQERSWFEVGPLLVLAHRRYDPESSRLHVEYTWIQGSDTVRRSMSARLYSYLEVVGLLNAVGFVDVEAFGSFGRDPFRLGSNRLIAVGTKGERG